MLNQESKQHTGRTFAASNYRRFYSAAKPPCFTHRLLAAVNNMLELYAIRMNPTLDQKMVFDGVNACMETIQKEAIKSNNDWETDVDAVAEYLWTSNKKHEMMQGIELCSVLNAVIRDDVANEIHAAAIIFRSINARRGVRRKGKVAETGESYPPNGETWRGGSFRDEFRAFFESMVGQKYRVPGFLATSSEHKVAAKFAFGSDESHPRAIWNIKFDRRGKDDYNYRVRHMSRVCKTLIAGEAEYLFATYSVFMLVSFKWSPELRCPHEFVIQAALDNAKEDEHMPLSPWY